MAKGNLKSVFWASPISSPYSLSSQLTCAVEWTLWIMLCNEKCYRMIEGNPCWLWYIVEVCYRPLLDLFSRMLFLLDWYCWTYFGRCRSLLYFTTGIAGSIRHACEGNSCAQHLLPWELPQWFRVVSLYEWLVDKRKKGKKEIAETIGKN